MADEIERSLEILGITGIEDKLQLGVAEAIVQIRQGRNQALGAHGSHLDWKRLREVARG